MKWKPVYKWVLVVLGIFFYFRFIYNPQITAFDRFIFSIQNPPPYQYKDGERDEYTGFRQVNNSNSGQNDSYFIKGKEVLQIRVDSNSSGKATIFVPLHNDDRFRHTRRDWRGFGAYYDMESGRFQYAWLRYRDEMVMPGAGTSPIVIMDDKNGILNADIVRKNEDAVWSAETDDSFSLGIGDVRLHPEIE